MFLLAIYSKDRTLSREGTCTFRLFIEIGRTSVKSNLKHWILMKKLPLSTHRSTLYQPTVFVIGQMSIFNVRCAPSIFEYMKANMNW